MESKSGILPRAAASAVQHALRVSPVVVVLGARQTGKTTLVRSLPQLAERPYLTLDDFDLRVQPAADPEAVVDRAPSLIIDEVQRVRDLLIAVKRAVGNVDFQSWPPAAAAIAALSRHYPSVRAYEPDGESAGYLQFQVFARVTHELVTNIQHEITDLMSPYDGECSSWGVLSPGQPG